MDRAPPAALTASAKHSPPALCLPDGPAPVSKRTTQVPSCDTSHHRAFLPIYSARVRAKSGQPLTGPKGHLQNHPADNPHHHAANSAGGHHAIAHVLQQEVFPEFTVSIGPLDKKLRLLAAVVSMTPPELLLSAHTSSTGRPAKDSTVLATAFLAKAVFARAFAEFSCRRHCRHREPTSHRPHQPRLHRRRRPRAYAGSPPARQENQQGKSTRAKAAPNLHPSQASQGLFRPCQSGRTGSSHPTSAGPVASAKAPRSFAPLR